MVDFHKDKSNWKRVKFGDVVRLNSERVADPAGEGIERYVGIEYIGPEDLWTRVSGIAWIERSQSE